MQSGFAILQTGISAMPGFGKKFVQLPFFNRQSSDLPLLIPSAQIAQQDDIPKLKMDFDLPLMSASLVHDEDSDVEEPTAPTRPDEFSRPVKVEKVPYRKRRGNAPFMVPSSHGTIDGLPVLRKVSERRRLSGECMPEPEAPDWEARARLPWLPVLTRQSW